MIITTISGYDDRVITASGLGDHLRLPDYTLEMSYLEVLIDASTEKVEQYTNRKLLNSTYDYYLNKWSNTDSITIPYGQLISVSSISYTDIDDIEYTLSSGIYTVDTISDPGRVVLKYNQVWPTVSLASDKPIKIRFTCGYTSVPAAIKQAILISAADMYERREDITLNMMPYSIKAFDRLLDNYRIWW